MGMLNPQVAEPVDKFSDIIGEEKPFILSGIRTVEVTTRDYGKGEMVVIRTPSHPKELAVWGAYLIAQAHAVEPSDLNKTYKMVRKVVPGFGRGSAVKCLELVG